MAKQNESTLKFKADISELKSAMQQAKTAVAGAKAEFDKSTEGLENWRKSSEGVEAKLKQLRSTLTAQNQILDNYRNQLARTVEQYGENSVQAEQLREKIEKQKSTISKTKSELSKYERSLADVAEAEKLAEREGISVEEALRKLSKSADNAEDSVDDLGKSAEDASGGFTVMKGAIASLVADGIKSFIGSVVGAVAETREFRNELAMLEATANTTGTGLDKAKENLKEIASITDDTGAGVEAMNNMMSAGFKGENLDKITEQLLGASIKWKDTLKMEGLADGLQETLATGNAVGPFAELLERGGKNLDTFNAGLAKTKTEAEKQQYILNQLSDLGLKPVLDDYKENNKYMLMNAEASYSLQESMAQFATKVEPVIATVKQGFADLFKTFLNMGDGINFEGIAEKISSGFGVVKQVLSGQMSMGELVSMGANWIKDLGSGLAKGIPDLISKGLDMIGTFVENLRANAPKFIQAGLGLIQNLVQGLMNSIPLLIAKVPTIVSNIAGVINDSGPMILKSAVNIILTIIKGLLSAIPTLVSNIPKIIKAIVDVWSAFNWMSLGKNAITNLGNGIKSLGGWLKGIGTNVKDWIVNAIKNLPQTLKSIGSSGIKGLGSAITGAKNFVVTAIKNIFNAIVDGIKGLPKKMLSIGKDIVKGLWNGISDMTGWVISKIQGFGESVLDGIKDFFGIHSPSKVMEKEVGKNIALGVAVGIEKNKEYAKKSAEEMGKLVVASAKKHIDTLKAGNKIKLADEVDYWKEIINHTKKGSDARLDAEKQYFNAKQKLNDQAKKAEETYTKSVSEAYKKLQTEIGKVVESYQKEVTARADAIANSMGLFEEFTKNVEVSGTQLLANLKSQVGGLEQWLATLANLEGRGIGGDLLDQLRQMGVKSLGELQALNSLTDEQLNEYVALWQRKNELAKQEATKELSGLLDESMAKIATLTEETNTALAGYKKVYDDAMSGLGLKVSDVMDQIVVSGKETGQTFPLDMAVEIQKTTKTKPFKEGVDAIRKTIKSSLDGVKSDVDTTVAHVLSAVATIKSALAEARSAQAELGAINAEKNSEGGKSETNVKNITYNQTINAPKSPSRTDVYRDTKNLLKRVGV